ncbi:MAG: DUF1835 domain-containing protein [Gemmatimonadaceae bacterium]|nr:DUF1835 domain-containing protein [Gemmatimonadaceae bacterium]
MKGRLHITNGDHAAKAIKVAGLAHDVLPWRDVLHDGPVPGALKLNELSRVRADFLAVNRRENPEEIRTEFTTRDAMFGLAAEHGRVTLWFESDLYDQLQLAQILAELFNAHAPFEESELIEVDGYLGPLDAAALNRAYESRVKLSIEHFQVAREIWEAFREPQPTRMLKFAARDYPVLPYMAAAIRRLFEEFPHTGTGLTGIQTAVLKSLQSGSVTPAALFTSFAEREERIFLGDASFATYLQEISEVEFPLALFSDGEPIVAPQGGEPLPDFWHRKIAITEMGEKVIGGQADHFALNGIDRWIGGVHLTREIAWRWDPGQRTLVKSQ